MVTRHTVRRCWSLRVRRRRPLAVEDHNPETNYNVEYFAPAFCSSTSPPYRAASTPGCCQSGKALAPAAAAVGAASTGSGSGCIHAAPHAASAPSESL